MVRDGPAVNYDALVEPAQVRASIEADTQATGLENRSDESGGRSFAVSAGDVNGRKLLLRMV